ncbi:MAG: hypothetical protein GY801_16255 [bacterium]|nr:hypothetical protein [bacterium]
MRKFSSYGQINKNLHYYVPRTELIEKAYRGLLGEIPDEGGHYLTVWAPRQTGKSSVMLEVAQKLRQTNMVDVISLNMQSAKSVQTVAGMLDLFVGDLGRKLHKTFPQITSWEHLPELFTSRYLNRPIVLLLDEFDALDEEFINSFANEFRRIYTERREETDKTSAEKTYLLHGLALIGVRSVLGIENVSGSPFNVQQSLHIPNLSFQEVEELFQWYRRESQQIIDREVIRSLCDETDGHPGLTCWFGELLTDSYNTDRNRQITQEQFEEVSAAAVKLLPNNTILNIISKVKHTPYKDVVLELFKTDSRLEFSYDDSTLNYLYLNGVITPEQEARTEYYVKFACPFIQKRIFNFFSHELFRYPGKLYEPFEDLSDSVTDTHLHVRPLLRRYERYVRQNRSWLFKDAPRRTDLRLYEAVYHFNLYMYLHHFFQNRNARVWPEFPTGNGKIDLLIQYREQLYGLEVKSYRDESAYRSALTQAARYGKELGLHEIFPICFVEEIDEQNRQKYETEHFDDDTGVTVIPVFVATGS